MNAIIITLVVIVIALVVMYNTLVARKNQVENIYATIDTQLKKRYDLIPNLVASVKEYMSHERELLDKLTKMRTEAMSPKIDTEKKLAIEGSISSALGGIMVAMENYPELKANQNVIELQHSLNEVEAQIAAARRAYNQAVTDYNNALEMIPTNIMAKQMGYERKAVFEIEQSERKNIDVASLFDKK